MNTELVSVIVPVYNVQEYLTQTIESVLCQTYREWELILVDDGSMDDSGRICDFFAQRDERISVIHTSNQGVSHARNIGLEQANGSWIAFLDGDDRWDERMLAYMLAHSYDSDIVACSFRRYPSGVTYPVVQEVTRFERFVETRILYGTAVEHYFFYSVWGKIYRKSLIQKEFEENHRHSEDEIFNLMTMPAAKGLCLIPDVLYYYRTNSDKSLTKHFWQDTIELSVKLYDMTAKAFEQDAEVMRYAKSSMLYRIRGYFIMLVNTLKQDECIKKTMINAMTQTPGFDRALEILHENHADWLWMAIQRRNTEQIYVAAKIAGIKDNLYKWMRRRKNVGGNDKRNHSSI